MATAVIRMSDGITQKDVTVSDTTPMIQRAVDAAAAINTAYSISDGRFKVIWSFRIAAGFNDRIEFAANLNGSANNINCTIPADNYTSGAALASAIQTAMQAAEDAFPGGKRVDITVTYTGGNKFNWAWTQVRATISQFIIRGSPSAGAGGYAATALDTVGIQKGIDQIGSGANGNFDGDYVVLVNRFKFGYSGLGASLKLADAAFTAEAFFGISDTTNQSFGAYLCGLDMTDPAPEAPPPPADRPPAYVQVLPGVTPSLVSTDVSPVIVPKTLTPEEALQRARSQQAPLSFAKMRKQNAQLHRLINRFDFGEQYRLKAVFRDMLHEERENFLKLSHAELRRRMNTLGGFRRF